MTKKIRQLLLILIFINGYVSLSLELIALRQVGIFAGSTAITASIIIGVFLAFMSWGYYWGSAMSLVKVRSRNLIYRSFIVITLMIVAAGSHSIVESNFAVMRALGIESNIIRTFVYSLLFLSLAPFLFGLNTALICRYLHRYSRDYTGRIMAVDTVGSVLGSLLTTLILMPFIGVNHTIILVVIISLCGVFAARPRKLDLMWFVLVIGATWVINSDRALYKQYSIVSNNAVSTIAVFDDDNGKSTRLIMNSSNSSKYSKDKSLLFRYVKYINETFIDSLPKDQKKEVLILGAGGFTMGNGDEFNNYTYVDIDKSLLRVSEEYFLKKKLSANKTFVVNDANLFLQENDKLYDLIVLDTYSGLEIIPEQLCTKEYFQKVKNRLAPNGIVVMNIVTSPNFANRFSINIDNTIRSVFGENLDRNVIGGYNAWENDHKKANNVIYAFYDKPNDGAVYSANKNSVIHDFRKIKGRTQK